MDNPFYWRHARDSLLTPAALRMFQLLAQHDGERFDEVKVQIDEDYRKATGTTADARHGGIIQTQLQAFREAGWVSIDTTSDAGGLIQITPAGKQALLLLTKVPDFLKAAPYFVIELLSRYQLNNPAHPEVQKNTEYDAKVAQSNVFPYWTLLKVIRSSDDMVSAAELRRFDTKPYTREIAIMEEVMKDAPPDYKRFIVFTYQEYYPSGGLSDACESFDTIEEALAYVAKLDVDDIWDILDCETRAAC